MCTIQGIKDAIRENYQSQYDMESADIDRLLQSLPFYQDEDPFDRLPPPKRLTRLRIAERHSLFHERLWLILCQKSERSEVNGGLSD